MTSATAPAKGGPGVVSEPAGGAPQRRQNPALRGPILLAIHGAEPSHAAVLAARLIAERLGRPLRVVTVLERTPALGAEMDLTPLPTAWEELGEMQTEGVRKVLRDVVGSEDRWTLEIRHGRMAREIARAAADLDATMIVVDAAPRRGLFRNVAGVRAVQLVQRARCPVLSVSSDFTGFARCIVAGTDFSPASIRALQGALLFAEEGARLVLLHVPLPIHLARPIRDRTGALIGGDPDALFKSLLEEIRGYAPVGLAIDTRTPGGTIVGEVLSEAEKAHADLIAVGAHGHNVVERFFVGSAATGILHGSSRTVLVAPQPGLEETVRLELRMGDTVVESDAGKWGEMLDAVSKRDAGRRATIEVDDPDVGAQFQASGYVFRGVVYDRRDGRIEIMLAAGAPDKVTGHLTRSIDDVASIGITVEPGGRDLALEIRHGRSHTLILFDD